MRAVKITIKNSLMASGGEKGQIERAVKVMKSFQSLMNLENINQSVK